MNARGDRTRERIVEATKELLSEAGAVPDISLRSVAKRAELTPMALYGHFANLDEIVIEAKKRFYAELFEALQDAVEGSDDPLVDLGVAYVGFALEDPGRYAILFATPVQFETLLGARALELVLHAVRDAGSERPETDGLTYWAALHGMAHLRIMRAVITWPDVAAQVRALTRTIGLRPEDPHQH